MFLSFFQTRKCHICSLIANSHDFLPPQLKTDHTSVLDLPGEWVSTKCETRQYGQFLTRHLTFYPDESSWKGRYDFYTDPSCLHPSFSLTVKGTFTIKTDSKTIIGAKNCNFRSHNLKVKPISQTITQNLNIFGGQGCGRPRSWESGVEQDVTSSGGCGSLGVVLPTVEHEVLKIERIHNKKYLFIGQRPTEKGVRPVNEWPTSFQEPLIQCSDTTDTARNTRRKVNNNLPLFQRYQSLQSSLANSIYDCFAHHLFLVTVSSFIISKL